MYWTTPLVLVCLMASQACCDHGQYVFVIRKLQFITCITNPINDICPVDHKVPDQISQLTNRTVFSQLLNSTSTVLSSANASESCIAANKMFQCSLRTYTCKDDESYVYLDSERVYTLCMNASQECMSVGQQLFNCSLYRNSTVRQNKSVTCKEYQKSENDTCPMRNYKVPSFVDSRKVANTHETAQMLLEQNSVGKNCTNDVLRTICDIGYPACTNNEVYAVSLVSKQRCLEIMRCVESANNTNATNAAMGLCGDLPDNTVKNLSIHAIENQMTTSPTPVSTTPLVTNSTTLEMSTTCGATRMSVMGHILVVFMVSFFVGSFAE